LLSLNSPTQSISVPISFDKIQTHHYHSRASLWYDHRDRIYGSNEIVYN